VKQHEKLIDLQKKSELFPREIDESLRQRVDQTSVEVENILTERREILAKRSNSVAVRYYPWFLLGLIINLCILAFLSFVSIRHKFHMKKVKNANRILDILFFVIAPMIIVYNLLQIKSTHLLMGKVPIERSYFTEFEALIISLCLAIFLFGIVQKKWRKW